MITAALLILLGATQAADAEPAWRKLASDDGVTVFARQHGETVELYAVGVVDGSPALAVRALERMTKETGRMPFLSEARVVRHTADGDLVYNRTSMPVVGDRDYTLLLTEEPVADGGLLMRFTSVNERGPPPRSDVTRVETDGSWRLQPTDDGEHTRATYRLTTPLEPGVPGIVQDWAMRVVANQIFAVLRTETAR